MTRTYALKRLLEHGGMNRAELLDCTRWDRRTLTRTLQQGLTTGVLVRRRLSSTVKRDRAFVFEVAQ